MKVCGAVSVLPSTTMLRPAGTVVTVMATVEAGEMLMLQLAVWVWRLASVTRPVKLKGPEALGVPATAPVPGVRTSGVGRAPPEREKV